MSNSSKLLKLCAVASSLLLAVGFVSYRAGAIDWLSEPDKPAGAPAGEAADESSPGPEVKYKNIAGFLSSSKSGAVFVGDGEAIYLPEDAEAPSTIDAPDPPAEPAEKDRTIMGGSKTLLPSGPPTLPVSPTVPKKNVILPGSKSSVIID